MAEATDEHIHDEAILWHLRSAAPDFDDWQSFAEWLEANPRHNAAYEAVADADRGLDRIVDLAPQSRPSNDDHARDDIEMVAPRRNWRFAAMAATIVLIVAGSWVTYGRIDGTYSVATAPGEMRTVALADGTRIALNGATRLLLDRNDPRHAELKSGEAKFAVHHDSANPFRLIIDDQQIVDVGTVFNVQKSSRALRVEVAEGAVRFEDGDVRLRLNAGDTLQANGDSIVEGNRPVTAIGTWVEGRLVYRQQPLVDVVGDLSRARGVAIELGPDLSARTFTGVIQLEGDQETVRRRFAQLLGLRVSRTSDGWSISR